MNDVIPSQACKWMFGYVRIQGSCPTQPNKTRSDGAPVVVCAVSTCRCNTERPLPARFTSFLLFLHSPLQEAWNTLAQILACTSIALLTSWTA